MSVAFMAALEDAPETYDSDFDKVLEGRATLIRTKILEIIKPGMRILDLGCGPGLLAIEAAKKGASVVGIDSDDKMIEVAKKNSSDMENPPTFRTEDILKLGEFADYEIAQARKESDLEPNIPLEGEYDLIVSTFLISELKPPQRDLFMYIVRTLLKKNGIFAIAGEVIPEKSSDRRKFWKNRSIAEKESRRRFPVPIQNLQELGEGAGLDIDQQRMYGPEISLIVGKKGESLASNEYQNRSRQYHGARARLRIWYNHTTGGWRGIPIKTGLYKVGNPTPDSPVVVTANYELTYYTVMRSLAKDGIDAWVLVCDTAGINVWCAARGIHFDSEDVIQMIRITRLSEFVNHREILLPQLAAAGMITSDIRERTGFRARYGPVRIQDLSEWLELDKPRPKPRKMAIVTFNFRERMEQTVAHIPFLYAAILAKPMAIVVALTLISGVGIGLLVPALTSLAFPATLYALLLIVGFNLALFGNAFVLGVLFPILPSKGNSFWRRGLGLAGITLPFAAIVMLHMNLSWTVIVTWMVIQFVMATSLTLDWSGMTSVSDPKVIRKEYPYMITTLKAGSIFVIAFNIVTLLVGW